MAFNIDYMANPAYGYEDEETRRRREEEERKRQQEALAQPVQPIAPQDINQYLAQNESGSNPNIGYHFRPDASGNRRSSAYGKYGITTNAYKDIQQRDPYFQNKSIESLSIADQDRAQNVYNGALTQQLQAYGVEATPGNIAAADFLGAKGFSDYLKTGAISNAAAQANGGADRVRQIVEQRRQFGNAPASGAAVEQGQGAPVSPDQLQQRTQQDQQAQVDQQLLGQGIKLPGVTPQPTVTPSTGAIESYQKNQDDPAALLNLRNDENLPSWIRERAGNRAFELLDMERKRTEAEQKMQATVQAAMAGDPKASREVANELSSKVATFGKMILAGFISPTLAREYAEELGFGNKSQVVRDEKGNVGMITVSASGKPVDGYLADGTKMNTEQLLKFAAGAGSQLDVVGGTYVNDKTGEVGRVVTDKKTGTSYVQTDAGRKPMTGFRPQSSTGTLADQRARIIQEINLKLQGKTAEEQMAILRPYNQQLAAQGLPTISPQEVGITAPQIAGGAAATTTTAAPAPAQAVTTTPAAPVARPTGPQLEAQKAATVEEAKDYVEYKSKELLPKATAAGDIKNIRKQQLYGPDGILQNPELAGILQGGQGSEVFNIMRDAISGNYKDMNDLSARIQSLNLDKRQKEVLYTQIGLQRLLGPMTIRDTAPVGSISDSEQRMNTQNQVDILRNPLYAGLTLMTRDQFEKDMTIAKRDFADRNPNLNTRAKLDAAWNKESSKLREQYDQVYAARAAYIGKHNPNGTNPGAVIDAYMHYPVPVFDNGRWDFGTDFARRAARPKLKEFER